MNSAACSKVNCSEGFDIYHKSKSNHKEIILDCQVMDPWFNANRIDEKWEDDEIGPLLSACNIRATEQTAEERKRVSIRLRNCDHYEVGFAPLTQKVLAVSLQQCFHAYLRTVK